MMPCPRPGEHLTYACQSLHTLCETCARSAAASRHGDRCVCCKAPIAGHQVNQILLNLMAKELATCHCGCLVSFDKLPKHLQDHADAQKWREGALEDEVAALRNENTSLQRVKTQLETKFAALERGRRQLETIVNQSKHQMDLCMNQMSSWTGEPTPSPASVPTRAISQDDEHRSRSRSRPRRWRSPRWQNTGPQPTIRVRSPALPVE